jgi:hypothetical protein
MRRYRTLLAAAVLLLVFAVLALTQGGPGAQTLPLLGVVAMLLLLELPAFWWRMRGGTAMTTWGVALACPLILFEALLGLSAWKQRGLGGDLQGVEQMLMIWVIPPAVLVSATLMTVLALVLIRPGDATG